jgi:hypothetical protein
MIAIANPIRERNEIIPLIAMPAPESFETVAVAAEPEYG